MNHHTSLILAAVIVAAGLVGFGSPLAANAMSMSGMHGDHHDGMHFRRHHHYSCEYHHRYHRSYSYRHHCGPIMGHRHMGYGYMRY
jgi:hypothetical protein